MITSESPGVVWCGVVSGVVWGGVVSGVVANSVQRSLNGFSTDDYGDSTDLECRPNV